MKKVVHFNHNCCYKFEILCSVGLYMNSECNKMTYSGTIGVKYLESFERSELELIFWRSGLTILNINATICYHHEQTVLKRFSSM